MHVNGYSKWRTRDQQHHRRRRSTRLPGIAGSAIDKPASGWLLHWSSTTRMRSTRKGVSHVLQNFEVSNCQTVLRKKLQRLKQTADIKSYNVEYSALIFRVEGMIMLDQVLCYANGLRHRTRTYVKLENYETLIDAMDLPAKQEVTHFTDDARDRQARRKTKKLNNLTAKRGKPVQEKYFRGKGPFKPKTDFKRTEG
ncbi:LOW QUALITY PROTEIN: hypothetical protein PHPALM_29982, partial [Phytophthora palmivora]